MRKKLKDTHKVTITLTKHQINKGKEDSLKLFGQQNLSGMIGFLINKWDKDTVKITPFKPQ